MTSRPVDALADSYVEEYAALDPIAATSAGIAGHDDRLPDLSPDGFAARDDLARRALAEMTDAAPPMRGRPWPATPSSSGSA